MFRSVPTRSALLLGLTVAAALTAAPAEARKRQPWRTPDDKLREFCPNRPTKGTSACTVDRGRWQVEADLAFGSRERSDGLTTTSWQFASPVIRYGISSRAEVSVGVPLFQTERTRDKATRAKRRRRGVGDVTVNATYMLKGNAGSDLALAVQPYVRLPTAPRGLGPGVVEGGVIVPLGLQGPKDTSLWVVPAVGVVKDETGKDRHTQVSAAVGASHDLPLGLNGSVELWAQRDFDPAGATTQASFDLGLGWTPKKAPDLQLDVGVNLGLTRETPDAEIYAGVAKRF